MGKRDVRAMFTHVPTVTSVTSEGWLCCYQVLYIHAACTQKLLYGSSLDCRIIMLVSRLSVRRARR